MVNPVRVSLQSNQMRVEVGMSLCHRFTTSRAEDLAKLFHHYHEALAHDFHGHASREAESSWEQAPQNERKLMIAAARLDACWNWLRLPTEVPANRQYFAKPGEADWGC